MNVRAWMEGCGCWAEAATVGCFGSVEGVGRREKASGGKRPGARQVKKGKEAVFLVFREKPRFERIFAAKMTGLPPRRAGAPIRQQPSNATSGQVDAGQEVWDVRCRG